MQENFEVNASANSGFNDKGVGHCILTKHGVSKFSTLQAALSIHITHIQESMHAHAHMNITSLSALSCMIQLRPARTEDGG